MPKTPEEYEAEIAKMQGQIDGLRDQNKNLSEAHATTVTEKANLEKEIADVRKKERDSIEAEAHAFNKDYDCNGKTNEVIKAYIQGRNEAKTDDPTIAPGIPHSTDGQKGTDDLSKKKSLAWMTK